jgi:hypothetical protein
MGPTQQIKCWFAYQYGKDMISDTGTSPANLYHLILCQLTGTKPKAPCLSSATNVWRRSNRKEIEAETSCEAERLNKNQKSDVASIRERVAKRLFEALSAEERDEWTSMAKEEHTEAMQKWIKELDQSPSTHPADRQR